MIADGADIGGLGTDNNMSAVAAFPDLDLALLKYLLQLIVLSRAR